MGLFLSSFGFVYISVVMDCILKWIEAISYQHNNYTTVIHFLKENLLIKFGTLEKIISDRSKYFCNKSFEPLIKKYEITHKIATLCHP